MLRVRKQVCCVDAYSGEGVTAAVLDTGGRVIILSGRSCFVFIIGKGAAEPADRGAYTYQIVCHKTSR